MPKMKSGGGFIYLPGKGGGKAKNPRSDVKEINYGLCDSSKHDDLDILGEFISNGTLKANVDQWFELDTIKSAFNASIAVVSAVAEAAVTLSSTDSIWYAPRVLLSAFSIPIETV